MMSLRKLGRFAMGSAIIWSAAACGGESGPSGSTTIDAGQAAAIGSAASSQIADLAGDLTSFSNPSSGVGGGLFAPQALSGRLSRVMGRSVPTEFRPQLALLAAQDENCIPSVSGDSTDSDGDGIQNNATYSFSAATCSYQDSLGNGFAVTGSIRVQDTDGGATLWGFNLAFNNLQVLFYTDSASAGFRYNGAYGATVTANAAVGVQDFTARWRVNDRPVFAADYNWQVAFAPDTGSIVVGQSDLQSGLFSVTGGFGWSGPAGSSDGDWLFTLSTPTALHYNESCSTDNQFDGGQVRATINGRSNVGFTVDYGPGCGEETVNTFDNNAT